MQIRIQILLIALTMVLASARSEARGVLPSNSSSPAATGRSLHGYTQAGVMFAQVGNTVPEPGTAALLALGGLAGAACLRKRKR